MQISSRIAQMKESATLATGAKAAAMKARGIDVVNLSVGEPDFVTPESIREAAKKALDQGRTKYAPTPGDMAVREVLAGKFARENGIACKPEHVTVCAGAKHAVYMILQTLVEAGAGDEIILPTPAWVSYRPIAELAGARCVEVPRSVESGFRLDPAAIERAITPRSVGLILNSPSNPCGTVLPPADLRALVEVLSRHPRVTLISDEIYEKLIYPEVSPGISHWSPGSDPRIAERTITVNGMSKAYAMTGWRLGCIVAPGDGGCFMKELIKLQGQMTNSVPASFMAAIIEAVTNGGEGVERMRRSFAARAKRMHEGLSRIERLRTVAPDGAFYAFPDIARCIGMTSRGGRRIDSAQAFADAVLEEAHVAVVAGEDFGECARTHVRLSFACSESDIDRGCERLAEFVGTLR
ncbi:MAG: pyridoxal phosphate-dependent aminotransferase [Phycisphaeraceae bacterium]|nr:pyridoxal phosphate-dependent aminotransferase [Phycisphaeraceae bacterium]